MMAKLIALVLVLFMCSFYGIEGEGETQCQKERDEIMNAINEGHLADAQPPQCDENGKYSVVDCSWGAFGENLGCYCVDPETGKQKEGTLEKDAYEVQLIEKCGGTLTKCQKAVKDYMDSGKVGGQFPSCDAKGNWNKLDCYYHGPEYHGCWCVDTETGVEIPETRKEGVYYEDMKCDDTKPAEAV